MDVCIITELSKCLKTFAINIHLKEKWSLSFLGLLSSSEETSERVYKFTVLPGQRDKAIVTHCDNPILFCNHHLAYKVWLHLFGIIPSTVDQGICVAGDSVPS